MSNEITGYELSKDWFDFCYDNPEKINPNHGAIYFFIIEHCNRLGWKRKFGLPMQMTMDAVGIKNYKTYSKAFNDLVDWGFVQVLEKSKNQYSANIVALVKNTKANTKALSKAMLKHSLKQVHGIVCIDKPITYNLEQEREVKPPTHNLDQLQTSYTIENCLVVAMKDERWVKANKATEAVLLSFNRVLEKRGCYEKNPKDYKEHFSNWIKENNLPQPATTKMVM